MWGPMKRKLLFTLGCLVGLATLSYGGYAWYNAITYVSTDDAYVEGTISPISAKVAGHIVELLVQDNQAVKKGDLLMLRPERWRKVELFGGLDGTPFSLDTHRLVVVAWK